MAQADTSQKRTVPDLTDFQRDLLFALAAVGPAHGLGVKEKLEAYYDDEVHHGQLYPNLDTVVDCGLVEKRDGADLRSNEYELTEIGLAAIRDRNAWENECLEEVVEV